MTSKDDRARIIGKVVSVTADRFVVEMQGRTDSFTVVGFEGMQYVARIGSFVIIPVQSERVVAEVVGLREKDTGAPASTGELEKVGSAKFLDLSPVGTIGEADASDTDENHRRTEFKFGVTKFPSLYADALYALSEELDLVFDTADKPVAIVSSSGASSAPAEAPTRLRTLAIGTSSVFQDYDVKVKIDAFFGGHVAILGNTGSGKSCTVAAIVQSLFERVDECHARGATFLVFDVNGEYETAFDSLPKDIKSVVLEVDGTASEGKLTLPHWMLDLDEWELLLKASERTQIPVLRNALGMATFLASTDAASDKQKAKLKQHIIASAVAGAFKGDVGGGSGGKGQLIWTVLERWKDDDISTKLLSDNGFNVQFGTFDTKVVSNGQDKFWAAINKLIDPQLELPSYRNVPFAFADLEIALELAILYEESRGNRQIRDYCSSMLSRHSVLKDRADYAFIRDTPAAGVKAEGLIANYFEKLLGLERKGELFAKGFNVIVLNLGAVDDEIVELVTSFVGRTLFRILRDTKERNQFPVHLILEEAHRYISERPSRYAMEANRVFERIAKEGRKYGLLLILASQRPSELSKTVLSQCANFLVHRIQNPDDLSQIRQMTPAISEAILKRLPTLPKQHALIFGSAVALPTTFKVRTADPRPNSHDAKVSELWYRSAESPLTIDLEIVLRKARMSVSPSKAPEEPSPSVVTAAPDDLDDEIPF